VKTSSARKYSEACEQNKQPILEILQTAFKHNTRVLEIGSGSGQHAVYFAQHLKHLTWQPSDLAENLPSIRAWMEEQEVTNIHSPIELDVAIQPWNISAVDAVFTANTLHIMSWEIVKHLFHGVSNLLHANGRLLVYGPFSYQGVHTSPSNARFDQYLKQQDSLSGVRDFEDLNDLAVANGLQFIEDYAMPVNNHCLLWHKN
jgi:cyclopropane fatty-acyl-phospholipid synthase-like methyltransferase